MGPTVGSMFRRRRSVALITDAKGSPLQNWRKRRVEYAILQGSRFPFLILGVLSYTLAHNIWLAGFFTLVSVPLPWIAVVIANAVGEPADPRQPRVYKPAQTREAYLAMHGALPGEQALALMQAQQKAQAHESECDPKSQEDQEQPPIVIEGDEADTDRPH